MAKTLRLILGDQLNIKHSWFEEVNEENTYLLMEMQQETNYVVHHIQKVVAFFAAMREFAETLKEQGHQVSYLKLDDKENTGDLKENLLQLIEKGKFERFEYLLPDEYRLDQQLREIGESLKIETSFADTEHFYTSREEMQNFFEKKKAKSWLMESFYRMMRKKHQIMLTGDEKPEGGKWNYDHSNRKKLPKNHKPTPPKLFQHQVESIEKMLTKEKVKTIGKLDAKNFPWPINREESLELFDYFLEECLPLFGDFQDAMAEDEWSIYHSRISFAMNSKMIGPKEVIDKTIKYWRKHEDKIDISQVEGFVRQILGWREYMRGIYWAKMPEYEKENQLDHQRKLPDWYWNGNTKMNCLKQSIDQSLDYAYAHHIQRLMVTGNFALLAGIKPEEVDAWYLGIYIDAIQWVELPNTRGMSQFADGGLIATKPYVSSANYIDKMSNYCGNCHYSKSKKTGDKACPFNSLYWNFIDQHLEKWSKNQRMSMMVANWKKQDPEKKAKVLEQAEKYLENLDTL
jgi:deoxyribodipyrimidine photolyase-related protein